jgi:hypothetical protein
MTKTGSDQRSGKKGKGSGKAKDSGKTTIKKLPPDVLAAVKEEAARTHRSVDGMIHEIVSQFVQKRKNENQRG